MADRSSLLLEDCLIDGLSPSAGPRAIAAWPVWDTFLQIWIVLARHGVGETAGPSLTLDSSTLARLVRRFFRPDAMPSVTEGENAQRRAHELAGMIADDAARAELARLLIAGDRDVRPNECPLESLHPLLFHAAERLSRLTRRPIDPCRAILPRWLSQPDAEDPWYLAAQRADAILRGVESDEGLPPRAVPRAREFGQRAKAAWREPASPRGPRLFELVEKLARFDELQARFDAALEQAKIESLAQFAAGAGHEINNPIAVISGRAQLLLDGETDAERRNSLALIHAQAVRVHEMIADLRLFARPPKPEFNPLDLTALVDRVIREMTDRAASQGTQLSAGPAQTVHIAADEVQLAVALKALVANSLEALREGGRVEIAIEAADGEVRIRVGDSGPGIAEEERRHIFDPYFAGRQAGRGLGMGLCKCWQIVRQHGGRIDVESPPGQGAAFTIVLPDRRTETESCDATQEPSPQ